MRTLPMRDVHFVIKEIHMVLKPYNDREAVPEEFFFFLLFFSARLAQ